MELVQKLVLYWKRGIVLYLANLAIIWVLVNLANVGDQVIGLLGRSISVGGIMPIVISWVAWPIAAGWLITIVVDRVRK